MAVATRIRRIEFNVGRVIQRGRRAMSAGLDELKDRMTEAILDKITDKKYPPASRPNTYPARRTGNLAATTRVMRKGKQLWVRTPQYGVWLQSGTRRMAKRKFFREVLFEGGGNRLKARWKRQLKASILRNAKKK